MSLESERLLAKVLGWWCPRCDVLADPWMPHPPWIERMRGWCMFCGMDPMEEGPARPPATEMVGLASIIDVVSRGMDAPNELYWKPS